MLFELVCCRGIRRFGGLVGFAIVWLVAREVWDRLGLGQTRRGGMLAFRNGRLEAV